MSENIIMVGLESSGKTTFLGALYEIVEHHTIDGALHLKEFSQDRAYASLIRDQWLQCKEMDHTASASRHKIELHLYDPATDNSCILIVPDLAGEAFNQQWEKRNVSFDYKNMLVAAGGIMLFLSCSKPVNNNPIPEGALGIEVPITSQEAKKEVKLEDQVFDPKNSSSQMKLVHLLQYASDVMVVKTINVAVILSAWDKMILVQPSYSPKQWLNQEASLLSQYLNSNPERFRYECFGVSAQGGDLKDSTVLLEKPAEERPYVVHNGTKSNDLTKIIRWILSDHF